MPVTHPVLLAAVLVVAAACAGGGDVTTATSGDPATGATEPAPATSAPPVPSAPPATEIPPTTRPSPFARPAWLGTRLLPLRPDGRGIAQPTPPELTDRRLATLDLLPPPAGETFESTLGPVPAEVLARSSWTEECPVGVDELRYATVSHYGFDGDYHTGELLVNAAVAEQMVEVFRRLHEARFPIEQMRVIRAEEIDAHPTGDGNDTTAFVCRPVVGATTWSQHAFGLGVDINPFHNPYQKGDLILPELASAYLDRADVRPGMIVEGDVVTTAFDELGWGWGGRWNTLDDWMHFSQTGG